MTLPRDPAEIELVARTICQPCDGSGSVTSDDWQGFREWMTRRGRGSLTPEDEDDLVERYFIEVCDYNAVPPMGEPCGICGSTGRVEVKITAQQLLDLVLEHVDRPIISEGELDAAVEHVKKGITSSALASQGLHDGLEAGSWLRAVQEGAEALRALAQLRASRRDQTHG